MAGAVPGMMWCYATRPPRREREVLLSHSACHAFEQEASGEHVWNLATDFSRSLMRPYLRRESRTNFRQDPQVKALIAACRAVDERRNAFLNCFPRYRLALPKETAAKIIEMWGVAIWLSHERVRTKVPRSPTAALPTQLCARRE